MIHTDAFTDGLPPGGHLYRDLVVSWGGTDGLFEPTLGVSSQPHRDRFPFPLYAHQVEGVAWLRSRPVVEKSRTPCGRPAKTKNK